MALIAASRVCWAGYMDRPFLPPHQATTRITCSTSFTSHPCAVLTCIPAFAQVPCTCKIVPQHQEYLLGGKSFVGHAPFKYSPGTHAFFRFGHTAARVIYYRTVIHAQLPQIKQRCGTRWLRFDYMLKILFRTTHIRWQNWSASAHMDLSVHRYCA